SRGRVIFFSLNPQSPLVQDHLAAGGTCVLSLEGSIEIRTGAEIIFVADLERVPLTRGGSVPFQVANVLAAAAAAWAAGVMPAFIGRALSSFEGGVEMTPGRLNLFSVSGTEVIVDYGHNEAAMSALAEFIGTLDRKRTVAVMTLPGDRSDDALAATVRGTVPFCDSYVFYDSKDLRGRRPGEVANLLKSSVAADRPVETASSLNEALKKAWARITREDRLLITADVVEEALETLNSFPAAPGEESPCEWPVSLPAG
ncbi:MAG TPA: cyanophycin synthetase, partial [Thermodesulfobacteriota bacterium]|nr:cyanophycin synthetase [Thermodesulfobacteriota bacterium]